VLLTVGFEFKPRLYMASSLNPRGAHAALIASAASSVPALKNSWRLQKETQSEKE
jgi:hypothetical protein